VLLQTNSYIVPRDKRMEHARLLRRFRQTLMRLGCDHFEVYEQVGANWSTAESTGRFVQIMRFRDRRHQMAVQSAERADPGAQAVIREFCDLINFPYQQQQGLFAVGFYVSFLKTGPQQSGAGTAAEAAAAPAEAQREPRVDPFAGGAGMGSEAETAQSLQPEQAAGAEIFGTTGAQADPENGHDEHADEVPGAMGGNGRHGEESTQPLQTEQPDQVNGVDRLEDANGGGILREIDLDSDPIDDQTAEHH
jgi:hypothetical protein